jgi:hypothetical protein
MTAGSLVVGRVETTTPLSGTLLIDDCAQVARGISDGSWVEGGLGAFSAVADGLQFLVDPLGAAFSAGVGWVIDHLEPIKGWFDDLTGDAGEVLGFAQTWGNIASRMQEVSDDLVRILGDLAEQSGRFVDAYRQYQGELAGHAAAAGQLASAIGTGMQVASTIVQIVHDLVRDALSQIVGSAISAAIEAVCSFGLATPIVIAQVADKVAVWAGKISRWVTKLLRSIRELLPRLKKAGELLEKLWKALDEAAATIARVEKRASEGLDDLLGGARRTTHTREPQPSESVLPRDSRPQSLDDRLAAMKDGTAEIPGSVPSYRGDVDNVVSFFDRTAAERYADGTYSTLGAPGGQSWVMPLDDARRLTSYDDVVIASGKAPSVTQAWQSGEDIFGLVVPGDGLDLRVPAAHSPGATPDFVPGGYTGLKADGGHLVTTIREMVLPGGSNIPPGTVLVRVGRDGGLIPIGVFG